MPSHIIRLKLDTVIMLIRNLDQRNELINGTRLIIHEMHKNFLVCKTLTGHKKRNIVAIPRIDLAPSETTLPFRLKRRQFLIILAFAMTIHKSQGQSYDSVSIYLLETLFTHGQLYVALSRVRNRDNLKIVLPKNPNGCIANVVYKELL